MIEIKVEHVESKHRFNVQAQVLQDFRAASQPRNLKLDVASPSNNSNFYKMRWDILNGA